MQIQLIRNATMRLTYGGRLLLTDPFLAPRHALRSFAGISPNPLGDLPVLAREVVDGVEMVIVSHLHSDHFDELAEALLPKTVPLFCQPGDEDQLKGRGFRDVTPVGESTEWQGISLTRTTGQHGTGQLAERMGRVSGFIFRAENEPTVYWAGDTIWYGEVAQIIADVRPDVIITHSSGARFGDSDPIVMDAEQTVAVCQAAPQAAVVAIHMESLDHGTVSRADLRALASANDIDSKRLLIPKDGETVAL